MPETKKVSRRIRPTVVAGNAKNKTVDFWREFQKFAFQDNLVTLAIGVVIGTSFKNVSTSLVENIIMPPLGLILGRVDFSNLYVPLTNHRYASLAEAEAAGVPILRYGLFLSTVLDFLLTALSVFLVIRYILRWKKQNGS